MLKFDTILPEEDLKGKPSQDGEQGVRIGTKFGSEPSEIVGIMDTWCFRVDKLIDLDVELHGKNTEYSYELKNSRGCTFSEFKDIYRNIDPDTYEEYPGYFAFGIKTTHDKERHVEKHPISLETYMYLLREKFQPGIMGYIERTFRSSQECRIPVKEFYAHTHIMAATESLKSGGILRHMWYDFQKNYPSFSLVLIDPHGDLADSLFYSHLNEADRERIIFIDPKLGMEQNLFACINPIKCTNKTRRNVDFAVKQLTLTFRQILAVTGQLSPVSEECLDACVDFLVSRETESTMDDLKNLLERVREF